MSIAAATARHNQKVAEEKIELLRTDPFQEPIVATNVATRIMLQTQGKIIDKEGNTREIALKALGAGTHKVSALVVTKVA